MTLSTSKLILPLLAFVFILSGCVYSSGRTDITDADMKQFVQGKSTYQEVLQKLGKPDSDRKQKMVLNGKDASVHIVIYDLSSYEAKTNAASFIPFVGAFVGTRETKSTKKFYTFMFDINTGILKTMGATDFGESNSTATFGSVTTDGKTTNVLDPLTDGTLGKFSIGK